MNELRIYQLLEPGVLASFRDAIRQVLFGPSENSAGVQFNISPISGWLYYAEHTKLYQNKTPALLPRDRAGIRQAATDWLRMYQERYLRAHQPGSPLENLPTVIPGIMRLVQIEPAFRSQSMIVDHWLVRFGIYLRVTGEYGQNSVRVLGAGLDLRIGNSGRVIGLSLRWRPVTSSRSVPWITPERAEQDSLGGHTHEENSKSGHDALTPDQLVYELQGESNYQTHLCPFYCQSSGHHQEMIPATPQSTVVRFQQTVLENSVDVEARIIGGSGQFDLNWSHWKPTDPAGDYHEQSGGTLYRLPGGVHNLLLIARDRASGQVIQRQETIYAATEGIAEPESLERPGCTDPTSPNYDPSANVDDGSCTATPTV